MALWLKADATFDIFFREIARALLAASEHRRIYGGATTQHCPREPAFIRGRSVACTTVTGCSLCSLSAAIQQPLTVICRRQIAVVGTLKAAISAVGKKPGKISTDSALAAARHPRTSGGRFFLPRDAYAQCGICYGSRGPSVCPSITRLYTAETIMSPAPRL